jgi:cbb3-type cytochrome oxidase subunit 3
VQPNLGAQVVIDSRTLRIGRETWFLTHIAWLDVVPLPPPPGAGKGNVRLSCLFSLVGCFGVFLFFSLLTSLLYAIDPQNVAGMATAGGVIVIALLLTAVLAWGFAYQKTKRPYYQQYALQLEVAGSRVTALISPSYLELSRIRDSIASAIENAPPMEIFIPVSPTVVFGDQINLFGSGSIGKVGNQ